MGRKWSRREFSKIAALNSGAVLYPAQGQNSPENVRIESAYSPNTGEWNIGWPGRLSQHDVVYLSPPEEPSLGLPIGNGDLGALLWTDKSELILAINKCDTWDDNEARPFRNWGPAEEENHTALRHCGRLVVDFGSPVFDLLYQQDFEARLELAPAMASLRARTEFARASVLSYASAEHRVLVLRCEPGGTEDYTVRTTLERWGSRTFAHWYSQVNRDASRGLNGTATRVERSRMVISQQLRTLSFVVMAQIVPDGASVAPRRLHSRAAAVDLTSSGFTVYVTAVTSENDSDPEEAAHRILDRAIADGEAVIRKRHQQDWRRFWSASMVDLPEKYLENIWHTNLYLANSSSRGAYPPHFCNGLWGSNRDFLPWNYYFHWNMQWYAWPLAAANHPELAVPYYRLRGIQLPHALTYASERLKKPGAFYADVSDRRGFNSVGVDHNQTPGAQIALDFWRQYAFTGDQRFLRESAWPVIREVTRFNAACLVEHTDGFYHISGTSAYEGSPLFADTITDLAMIRALFPVAIRAGRMLGHDPTEIARWQAMVDRLTPFHLADLEEWEFERKGHVLVHRAGLAPGKPLVSRKVFAVGRDSKGAWVRNRYAGRPDMAYYGIPDPEIAPVFPAGVIGLAQQGTELFQAAVTQLRLHPPAVPDPNLCEAGTMTGSGKLCMGWCPYPIALARLGLADELVSELVNSVSTWQFYPQGFGHYGPYDVFKRARDLRWRENLVRDAATVTPGRQPDKFPFPSWPFRHFDNEAMPIAACAMNEMLLQSHDGAIRICPAVPAQWQVRFDLAAAGGFRVSAERRDGRTEWVALESRQGGRCRVVHPWPAEPGILCLELTEMGSRAVSMRETASGNDRILSWEAVTGRRYLLVRDADALKTWKTVPVNPKRRPGPRRLKQARLGRERLF